MDFNALKDALVASIEQMKNNAASGEPPTEKDAEALLRTARLLHTAADVDDADDCEDVSQMATQLLKAVRKNQSSEAIRLVDSLNDALSIFM